MSNKEKGFGLLEVLLAGLIIIMMLSALVVVARAAIESNIYVQQRFQATFLAQEGMERVRHIRDTSYVDGDYTSKWNTFFAECPQQTIPADPAPACVSTSTLWQTIDTAKTYMIDFVPIDNLSPPAPANMRFILCEHSKCVHKILFLADVYETGAGGTRYRRRVKLKQVNPPHGNLLPAIGGTDPNPDGKNAYKVTVSVEWDYQGIPKEVDIEELLTNSRQGF